MVYLGQSWSKASAAVYTDDRARLVVGIMKRAGEKLVAIKSGAATQKAMKSVGAAF
jgi:hypothetical protein